MTAPGHHQLPQTLRPRDSAFDMAFALGSELRWEIPCGALQRPGEIDTNVCHATTSCTRSDGFAYHGSSRLCGLCVLFVNPRHSGHARVLRTTRIHHRGLREHRAEWDSMVGGRGTHGGMDAT